MAGPLFPTPPPPPPTTVQTALSSVKLRLSLCEVDGFHALWNETLVSLFHLS
jgi:hypothetical protein